jgi:cellulose synthase/poly-beta-1,6-N-acetylglucosamine synthase-like glycosyltransferase
MSAIFIIYLIILILDLLSLPYFAYILVTSVAALVRPNAASSPKSVRGGQRPQKRRFLVVVPAHDEETTVARTVQSCTAFRYPNSLFEVLVIADNCTDQTVLRAREAGARILERFDVTKKSKGHAIEYLIRILRETGEFDSLDALVVVDADTTVHPDLLRRFSESLDLNWEWIQCYNCVGNGDQSWRTRMVAYAFGLFNGVLLLGQSALGLSVALRGNGMCLSTSGLRRVPWEARGLVEDLEYSWAVRLAGGRIRFARDVAVYSVMLVEGGKPSVNQRRRWEFGRSVTRRNVLLPLLRSSRFGLLQKAAATIELTSLPMINLLCIYGLNSVLSLYLVPDMINNNRHILLSLIATFQTIYALALIVYALSPFLLSFVPWRFAGSLICLPYYAIWKWYVMAHGRPAEWMRTPREKARDKSTPIEPGSMLSALIENSQHPAESEF